MNLKESHNKRVQKVKNFTENNKMFSVIAVIVVIYLLFSIVGSKLSDDDNNPNETTSQSQSEMLQKSETAAVSEAAGDHWRFYWIDLWILVGAGGFCSVMIIRERKKAREKLQ